MELKEIYKKIITNQINGVMFHHKAETLFDFLMLNGLKSWSEYQYFKENLCMRKTICYVINHHNIIPLEETPSEQDIIPISWYNYTRFDVDISTKKSKIKEMFSKFHDWERDAKSFYSNMYNELINIGHIADSVEIKKFISDVDKELKCIDKKWLEYKSVDYNMDYIMKDQFLLHEKYKKEKHALLFEI